jgi:hypothetical protein
VLIDAGPRVASGLTETNYTDCGQGGSASSVRLLFGSVGRPSPIVAKEDNCETNLYTRPDGIEVL